MPDALLKRPVLTRKQIWIWNLYGDLRGKAHNDMGEHRIMDTEILAALTIRGIVLQTVQESVAKQLDIVDTRYFYLKEKYPHKKTDGNSTSSN